MATRATSKEPEVRLEAWAELYRQAGEVRRLAPWTEMLETELFALEDPDTKQLCFVSIMGARKEHLAVAVYLGEAGLRTFWRAHEVANAHEIIDAPHLQASWEDRRMLGAPDTEVIRALGLKFRGREAWPMFRSYRPGHFPWSLEPREVSVLTHALGQVVDVAARRAEQPDLLVSGVEGSYLLRRAEKRSTGWQWSDGRIELPPRNEEDGAGSPPFSDEMMLARLRKLERLAVPLELDLFTLPGGVQEHPGQRPRRIYTVLVVDSRSGWVLSQQVLEAVPSWEAMLDGTAPWLASAFAQFRVLPAEIRVRSRRLCQALSPLAAALGIELRRANRLPALDAARQALEQAF